jgi:GT2 family glycosyltransferase
MRLTRPDFSIVVPTRARPKELARCLAALGRVHFPPHRFEVIISVDGDECFPEEQIRTLAGRLRISVVRQAHAGPAAARNAGAGRAEGEFLVFTDDDCEPSPDWLTHLARRFAGNAEQIIGGRTVNALRRNIYSAASQLIVDTVYEYYNANPERAQFFASNNIALPAKQYAALGGFDPSFPLPGAEDRDFCDRCLRRGYRLTYAPEVVMYHLHELTPRSLWRQHFAYGRGASLFHQARFRRGQGRVRVALRFHVRLLRIALGQKPLGRALAMAGLASLTQIAYVTGFVREEARHIWPRRAFPPAAMTG